MASEHGSAQQIAEGLRAAGYLADPSTALVSHLAIALDKPILVEGPAGVGKTELAKALASYLDRKLVRLQCYEGLDEAKALYEWNYRKQLLRIQAGSDRASIRGPEAPENVPGASNDRASIRGPEAPENVPGASNDRASIRGPEAPENVPGASSDRASIRGPEAPENVPGASNDTGWDAVQDDIFGEEFLLARPLMTAISSPEPVVLLIDEIDKTDQEFEAMLLELLSDFQISIPELGRIEATTQPVVLLTSNNSRELTEALKRRCLYLWLDYPTAERELQIVRLHTPQLAETVARKLVEVVAMVRELDLKKPPSIAESVDWARALLLLGAQDIDRDTFNETISIIVKHRTDLDLVAERVGVRLDARVT